MLRVLLVDDEYIVLKGMEAMLAEQKTVALQLFTTCDAVEALADLEKIRPDVIIADINMPEIDGLTLIQKVQERNVRCRFIICTGYDKVEYLHRAIRQQVAEYLLKPVDRNALIEKLVQLEAQKMQEQEESLFLLKMCLLFHQGDALLDETEIQAVLPQKHYRLCAVAEGDAPERQEGFARYYEHVLPLHRHQNSVLLLGSERLLTGEQAEEICALVLTEKQRWGLSASIETSKIRHGEALAEQESYEQAMADFVIHALPIPPEKRAQLRKSIARLPSPLRLHGVGREALQQHLSQLIAVLGSADMAFFRVFADFTGMGLSPASAWPATAVLAETALAAQVRVTDADSLYQETVRLFGSKLPELSGGEEEADGQSKIDRAAKYIQQHYREDISLDLVAGHVALHPSYFSYLFKKKTGEPFLWYLHTLRLEAACRLMLERPGLSIETVGAMAGYRTTTYFHKAFRQRFHASPREWSAAQAAPPER